MRASHLSLPLAAVLLLTSGCGKGADGGTPEDLGFAWEGGDFQFTTWAATDACLDGAMEALFMPEGPESPWDFEFPLRLPAYDELPASYDVDFRDPFVGMPVTVDAAADGTFQVRGAVMDAVEMGRAAYGYCVVTMAVDADMLPTSADTAEGEARISVSAPRGEDERCPAFASDPCTVTLLLEATRL